MATQNLNPGDLFFGSAFNDASRVAEGGFWHNVVPVGNQGSGTDVRYTNDLTTIQTGLTADVAAGDFTGDQLTHINTVLADLTTALAAVPGALADDAASQAALHTAHLDIINTINNDPVLQALSVNPADMNPGFNAVPPALAVPFNAATPHATFQEIGAIFDDVQNKSIGGFNTTTLPGVQTELTTAKTALSDLMAAHPEQFGGITGIHAQTIVDQLNLQITNFDNAYGTNPDAGRSTNDNLLDITDIVNGDPNLANMAAGHGFTGAPAAPTPATPYQDNAAETNFWADFIASSNSLGTQAVALSQDGNPGQINQFIKVLNGFEANVQNFDAAQGGIFEARFDNELLGINATIGADVAGITKGLQSGNATLVQAGADAFHANAADVSGNNVPVNGGTYNANGVTIADALNMTVPPPPPATMLTPSTPAAVASIDHMWYHDMFHIG